VTKRTPLASFGGGTRPDTLVKIHTQTKPCTVPSHIAVSKPTNIQGTVTSRDIKQW
jgi:hypothetical protein